MLQSLVGSNCPECGKKLSVHKDHFRKTFKCHHCGYRGSSSNTPRKGSLHRKKVSIGIIAFLIIFLTLAIIVDSLP